MVSSENKAVDLVIPGSPVWIDGLHLPLELVYISLGSDCMGLSSHRYGWWLQMKWSSMRELKRLSVGEGMGSPCVAVACRGQMEDHKLLI